MIDQALQTLDTADGLCSVKLDLGGDGILQRDEPAFDKLLSSPSMFLMSVHALSLDGFKGSFSHVALLYRAALSSYPPWYT
jgi:hypothetical protein